MTLNEYQQKALETADKSCKTVSYLTIALCGESGEVAEKVKKAIRDRNGKFFAPDLDALALELGDVLWYLSVLANLLGFKLEEIAEKNLLKINYRLQNGKLHGEGDYR